MIASTASTARAARLRGACASLLCLRMMSIFPSEDGGQRAAAEPRVKLPLESAQPPALVGFYSVYDDLASEDALASMADGGPTASIFSATMVLRADGQTSRGSEFPGGSWAAAERDGRVRLSMTLRAGRARAEERRYDGLVLEFEAPPDFDDDGEAPPPPDAAGEAGGSGRTELRVVGEVSRWSTADAAAPRQLGEPKPFSMVGIEVDRTTLTPTIKPRAQELDPAEVRRQQEWQRVRDRSEADALRQVLNDVRELKAEGVSADELAERMRPGDDAFVDPDDDRLP